MRVQARKAEGIGTTAYQTLVVYYAPHRLAQNIAQFVVQSWEGVDSVLPMIFEREEEVLSVLGQPELTISDMLEHAAT